MKLYFILINLLPYVGFNKFNCIHGKKIWTDFCSKLCNILWLNVGRSDMPRKKYCPARSEFILLNTIYFIGLRKGVSGPGCSQWLLQVQEINAVRM